MRFFPRQHCRDGRTAGPRHAVAAALGALTAGLVGVVPLVPAAAASTSAPVGRASLTSLKFHGPFVPEQVVAQAGVIWVLGSSGPTSCSIESVDPATLHRRSYPLPLCAYYVTVGNGVIYLAGDEPDDNSDVWHLEVFNPATKQATVMSPVLITTQGSGRAHMDMAYGSGSVWMSSWGSTVVRVSPSTGAVLERVTNAPQSEGGHGSIVANRAGLWMAEGSSSTGSVFRLVAGSPNISKVYTGPPASSVLWLSSIGDEVWAVVETGHPGRGAVSTHFVTLDLSGRQILQGPSEVVGDEPMVGSGDVLWTVGTGGTCAAPQRLWQIDAATGKSTAVATLPSPVEPCLTEDPTTSVLAVDGGFVFVLEPTGSVAPAGLLYRVQVAAGRHRRGA